MGLKKRTEKLRRLLGDQSGNVLAIFAGSLVPLTILVGSGLDLGTAYMAQAKLQNACDAGVLAGRQNMPGNNWNNTAKAEAERFFTFNFPNGSHGVTNATFTVGQSTTDPSEVVGSATGTVPTFLMAMFGYRTLSISAACDATRDLGHNDVVLVLDVTGSMLQAPSNGSGTKIERLRTGALGLYRALGNETNGSITRYGIVPYSHTVNVARSLSNTDFLINQPYVAGDWNWELCDWNAAQSQISNCVAQPKVVRRPTLGVTSDGRKFVRNVSFNRTSATQNVHINASSWAPGGGTTDQMLTRFRNSGQGCIEERHTVGDTGTPIRIRTLITRSDVDSRAADQDQTRLQFGRYDPDVQNGHSQDGCPNEATPLQQYASEAAYGTAINAATASPTGGTYHDVGMLWGTRFISRTGFFRANNPAFRGDIAVNQHIVFMTDGMLDTRGTLYSSHGVENHQARTRGTSGQSQRDRHVARFNAACDVAKAMGVTVWVIALDVTDTSLVEPCATSEEHFFTSDGSNLEQVFQDIGQGIGNLRLTR